VGPGEENVAFGALEVLIGGSRVWPPLPGLQTRCLGLAPTVILSPLFPPHNTGGAFGPEEGAVLGGRDRDLMTLSPDIHARTYHAPHLIRSGGPFHHKISHFDPVPSRPGVWTPVLPH
jgi:hypothetical protein